MVGIGNISSCESPQKGVKLDERPYEEFTCRGKASTSDQSPLYALNDICGNAGLLYGAIVSGGLPHPTSAPLHLKRPGKSPRADITLERMREVGNESPTRNKIG